MTHIKWRTYNIRHLQELIAGDPKQCKHRHVYAYPKKGWIESYGVDALIVGVLTQSIVEVFEYQEQYCHVYSCKTEQLDEIVALLAHYGQTISLHAYAEHDKKPQPKPVVEPFDVSLN